MVGGVTLANLFVFGVVAFSLYQSFGEVEERADVTTQSLSRLLAEGIAGDLDKIDVVLLNVADEIERQIASGGIDRKALNAFLDRKQGRLPETFSVRVLDTKGIVSYGQGVNPIARQNNSDREYFIRQRDNPKAGLVIAKPILTRIDKKWAIVLSRPIHLPDGSFGGVAYVNVGLDYLTKTFPSIDVGKHGSVSLRGAGLDIYAIYPVPANVDKVIGEKLAVPELQELIQAGRDSGTYITNHTLDGFERKFAVRKVSDYPLYVVVGRATEEYMAQWKDQAIKTSVLVVLFFLGTLISSWRSYRDNADRKMAEEQIRNLAFYDTLTQLPNRRLLNDRLTQTMAASKRNGRYAAMMFLDLDNFKPLNDTYGHGVGDLLLIEVALRIKSCVREIDTVARFGGDEFIVMLSELNEDKAESTTEASNVAEKIRSALAEPYTLKFQQNGKTESVEHHCTSSIGVVLFINHEASVDDLFKWADIAMYQAKAAGRDLIRFYESKH